MSKEYNKCADCVHTGAMISQYTVRCKVLHIGKVKNQPRLCDHFEKKERSEDGKKDNKAVSRRARGR